MLWMNYIATMKEEKKGKKFKVLFKSLILYNEKKIVSIKKFLKKNG